MPFPLVFVDEKESEREQRHRDEAVIRFPDRAFTDPHGGIVRTPFAIRILTFSQPGESTARGYTAQHLTIGRSDDEGVKHILDKGFFPNHADSVVSFDNGQPLLSPFAFLMVGRVEAGREPWNSSEAEMRTVMCVNDQRREGGMIDTFSSVRSLLRYQLLIRPDMAKAFEAWLDELSVREASEFSGRNFVACDGLYVPSSPEVQPEDEEGVRDERAGDVITQEDESSQGNSGSLRHGFDEEANPDIAHKVAKRADDLIPTISDDEIRWWEKHINKARDNPPEDKYLFVDSVNRVLDVFRLRLDVGDGLHYRLRVNPGASGRGFIQFSGPRGASRGGFTRVPIRLVKVPSNYVGASPSKSLNP